MVESALAAPRSAMAERVEAVHAPILQLYPELVSELGGDAGGYFTQAGIDPAEAARGDFHPSYRQTAELLELAAEGLRCPDFGMRLASRQCSVPVSGPLGDAVRHARNFGEALELIASHSYAHSLAAGIWLRRAASGQATTLGHDILIDGVPARRQLAEFVLLTHQLWAIRLTGGLVRGRRIQLRHQSMSPLRVYRAYFGCDVRFDQAINGLVFHDRDLNRAVVAADQEALQSALSGIESRFPQREAPLSVLTRGVILHFLGTDLCTTETVARTLNLHPRTLRRRLRQEGASFRQILDQVRCDHLAYLLRHTQFDLTDISERLGFAEQSVLTRYCRRWLSLSPTQVRARRAP